MSYLRMLEFPFFGRPPANILDRVLRVINSYVGQPVNSTTLKDMQREVDKLFTKSKGSGERWTLFEGIEVRGAHVFVVDGLVTFRWLTNFYPNARYASQYGRVDPLGFYREFDLYFLRQGTLAPVVIARFGAAVEDARVELVNGAKSPEHVEAVSRAEALGMLDARIPDEPVQYGMNFLV